VHPQVDFILAAELSRLTGRKLKTIYDDHARHSGPLVSILTKFGGRLGAWRPDYEKFVEQQLRLKDIENA
jgi:hypothetical protein